MDEARTLAFLGWTIGGIVGAVFVLNAIALSLL
jgi:gas vesicle protein